MNSRDPNKRLKGFGIPIETCIRYERMIGLKPGQEPNKSQREAISKAMVSVLTEGVAHIKLTAEDYRLIYEEVKRNEG